MKKIFHLLPPFFLSREMKAHIAGYGTVLESWFPLGGRGNTHLLFEDPVIASIAEAHGKSPAQVIIRWHLEAGNICIPGSSNEQHIIEDYDVWDFALTEAEFAAMNALGAGQAVCGLLMEEGQRTALCVVKRMDYR